MHIGIGTGIALGSSNANRYQTFELNGILGTGQSLSLGQTGTPALSTTQPYSNKMFVGGVKSITGPDQASLVPLIEGVAPAAETPMSSMANFVTSLAPSHDALAAGHGVSATAYAGLRKGTTPYANGIAQATAGLARANDLGKTFGVAGMMIVHGESDEAAGNTHYASDIITWQSDYQTDIIAVTGQRGPIPHFHTQPSTIPSGIIPLQMLAAHITRPGKVILVGPKYHLPYSDGTHLTNAGYLHLGKHYGRVYHDVVVLGRTWEPLRPSNVSISGAVITIRFFVPVKPLVLDTSLVAAATDMGFDFIGAGPDAGISVSTVAITGNDDSVQITLSGAPTVAGRIRYAQLEASGNLRDSDATGGEAIFNWCVHFDETVTP